MKIYKINLYTLYLYSTHRFVCDDLHALMNESVGVHLTLSLGLNALVRVRI